MTKKLLDAVTRQKKSTQPSELEILGSVGALINGQRVVEVPNRNSFIYIRLQDNPNEIIQAFNNQVSPSYNLPVKLVWKDNRYIVLGVDTARYQNNWPSFAPYLPRHGTQHSFSEPPGGDIAWIYSRQFMPMLPIPSGSNGAAQVIINSSVYRHPDGTWDFIGAQGTPDLTLPKPTDSQARMLLLYWDLSADAPAALTGSFFAESITGTSQILDYLPTISDSTKVPLAGIRLVSGTSTIGWDNIYDVRQFAVNVPPAFGGGFGIMEEGIIQGTGTILNFIGNGVTATVSGTVAQILVTAEGSGGDSVWTTGTAGSFSITTKDGSNDSRGNRALSHGQNTLALASNSHSEGSGSIASGTNSHAEGQSTLTRGQASHSEGMSTKAVGQASHAEGINSIASGTYSHVEGEENVAFGYASHVAGGFNEGRGTYSAIIAGALNSLVGDYSSILAGQGITGSAPNTAYTDYMNVRSLGTGTSVQNVGIDAEGFLVPGTAGGGSGAERFWTSGTIGIRSIRNLGGSGDARGDYSFVMGLSNNAWGNYATALGTSNIANGEASAVLAGLGNLVSGSNSAILAGLGNAVTGHRSSVLAGTTITGSADDTAYTDYMNIRRLFPDFPMGILGRGANGNIVTGTASAVPIADSGGYFTGTDVEAALRELGLVKIIGNARLSLESGVPLSTSDRTAQTTVYWTDGTRNLSVSVPATTNTPFDIFYDLVNGDLETVNWSDANTRATALTRADGYLVKSGDTTKLYLGTGMTTGTSGQCEDSLVNRLLYNYYNRRRRMLRVTGTTSHTYTSSTIRYWNNSSAMQVNFVMGVVEDDILISLLNQMTGATGANTDAGSVGFAINDASPSALSGVSYWASAINMRASSSVQFRPIEGRNNVGLMERGLTDVTFSVAQLQMFVDI